MTTSFLQFTEEKLGQAEKTELDAHFENLLARADSTKNWTEKILRQTEVLLQPNPSKSKPHCLKDNHCSYLTVKSCPLAESLADWGCKECVFVPVLHPLVAER